VKVEEQDIEAIAEAIETLEAMKQTNPELWYQPGKNGQEQAHRGGSSTATPTDQRRPTP